MSRKPPVISFSSNRSVSPSLDELKHFSKHLERRMSRLIMVKNAGILSIMDQDLYAKDFVEVFIFLIISAKNKDKNLKTS